MTIDCEVVIVGSGFAGSLLARVLAVQGYDVMLLERGTHPRFAIGESTTPLANLSLERLATRYGLRDCYRLAAHGRWMAHYPELRRGLKRGFVPGRCSSTTVFMLSNTSAWVQPPKKTSARSMARRNAPMAWLSVNSRYR